LDSEEYTLDSEEYALDSEEYTLDSEEYALDSEEYALDSEEYALYSEEYAPHSEEYAPRSSTPASAKLPLPPKCVGGKGMANIREPLKTLVSFEAPRIVTLFQKQYLYKSTCYSLNFC
jgi:hypothetical protein